MSHLLSNLLTDKLRAPTCVNPGVSWLMLMLMLWPLAVTPGVTHVGVFHRPSDGNFFYLLKPIFFDICWLEGDIFDIFFGFDICWRCRHLTSTGRPVFNQVSIDLPSLNSVMIIMLVIMMMITMAMMIMLMMVLRTRMLKMLRTRMLLRMLLKDQEAVECCNISLWWKVYSVWL